MTIEGLTPFRWQLSPYGDRGNSLGEIYCVTLLRELDPSARTLNQAGSSVAVESPRQPSREAGSRG
ncbi:hypothetical protein [Nonomuraea sp. NPDC001699]